MDEDIPYGGGGERIEENSVPTNDVLQRVVSQSLRRSVDGCDVRLRLTG